MFNLQYITKPLLRTSYGDMYFIYLCGRPQVTTVVKYVDNSLQSLGPQTPKYVVSGELQLRPRRPCLCKFLIIIKPPNQKPGMISRLHLELHAEIPKSGAGERNHMYIAGYYTS